MPGRSLAGAYSPEIRPGLTGAFISAGEFFVRAVQRDWLVLLQGWSFGVPLLAILLVHELGHYLTARRYAIDTTPPFFIPVPPTLSPIGSLGAFIRVRSPVVDRRQLLDVGAAGPLAGFVVAIAVLIWGYSTSERIPIVLGSAPSYVTLVGQPLFLGESLLTGWLRDWLLPGTAAVHLSLPAFAGWVGMFITGLNLIPLSQLDGGHVTYGMLGRRAAPGRAAGGAGPALAGAALAELDRLGGVCLPGGRRADRTPLRDGAPPAHSAQPLAGGAGLCGGVCADVRAGAV